MIDAHFSRLLVTLLLLPSAMIAAASQNSFSKDWEALRKMDVDEIRSLNAGHESPRHRLFLSLHEVGDGALAASAHLDKVLSSADPGSDEAKLAGMLQCTFQEFIGTPLSYSACAERAISITSIAHPFPAALAQLHHGIWLTINGEYLESFKANRRAEELALMAGDRRLASTTQNNQGVAYLNRGLPVQALKKFQTALEHVRDSDTPDRRSLLTLLTGNIAATHLELGDFESANALLQTFMNGEQYDRNNPANLINEVILARLAQGLDRTREGYERLHGVLQEVGSRGVTDVQAYAHSTVGELQVALGNIEAGVESFILAQEFGQRSGDPLRISKVDISFAATLVGLKRYEQAETIIEANIEALAAHGPSMILAQALDLRGDVLNAAGQLNTADAAKRQAQQMRLNVAGAEHALDLAMLGKSLELANKANELANARQEATLREAKAQRDIALRNQLVMIALLLAFIIYLVLSRQMERKVAKTIQNANAELEVKVTERTAALELEMAERLRAEGERQSLAQSLAESEKLQALGQLTSGVAHDFNNLMTVVTLAAGQLRNDVEIASDKSVSDVDNILSAAESASDITASLLAYARKQRLTPQPTNIESFVSESRMLFESTLGKGMSLEIEVQPCAILVDRGQLTTAIVNLLLNAKETMQGIGKVSLEVDELLQVNEKGESTQWTTICVTDLGQGMTPDELRHATEPFYTTKSVGHGIGLGLSMVDGFARQSGGFLKIDSTKGKGTVVSLCIPPYSGSALSDGAAGVQGEDKLTEGLVIVVDDQEVIRDVLCRLLEQMGLETLSASSGAGALHLLAQSKPPSLLITDLSMPGEIDGQQLAVEARKRYADLPVLIMSGYANSVDLDVEFLHKPFSLVDLREAITRAIAHKRSTRA